MQQRLHAAPPAQCTCTLQCWGSAGRVPRLGAAVCSHCPPPASLPPWIAAPRSDASLPPLQVTRAALGNDCTLICGWSNQECARYLETFKRWAAAFTGRPGGGSQRTVVAACQRHGLHGYMHPPARTLPVLSSGRLPWPSTLGAPPNCVHGTLPSTFSSPLPMRSYENKPAEVIQKDLGTDYLSRINATLTTVRGVNRTDVKTLGDRCGLARPTSCFVFKGGAGDGVGMRGCASVRAAKGAGQLRGVLRGGRI